MPLFDCDHEPEVITINGLPTAQFVLIGEQTPDWRSDFIVETAEYRVRTGLVGGGKTGVFIPLPDVTNIYGVLNAVTDALGDAKIPRLPPEVSAELIDNDELRTVASRVGAWWGGYKQVNSPNR